MTREEAIKILKYLMPIPYRGDSKSTSHLLLINALGMAIKALETLEEFEKAQIITGGRLNGRTYAYKCGLEDGKRKALEQEPKTGHWMIVEDSIDLFFATYECSCCKRAIIVPHDAMKAVYKDYPYCHCGTKMVEPQAENKDI